MSDNKSKNIPKSKGKVSPVIAAAVTGAVVGAGVVAAGVATMRNNENRNKAKKIINEVKAKASTYMHAAEDQVDEGKSKIEKTEQVIKESNQKVKKIWQK